MSADARTLPVTPAERACATITAAWLKWPGTARQPHQDALQSALMAIGDILIDAGLVNDDYKATPAGAALLARVEADRSAEDIARDLVMALQTSGAPGVLVSEAQSVLVNVRACDRRLAGTTPIDAPPASPERPAYARAKALIDALNKDGGGAVVNGMLHAAIIAEANARDADRVEAAERTPAAPPGICQGQMHAYRCALPVGHTGLHADEGRFTLWPDAADTRPVVDAADAKGLT